MQQILGAYEIGFFPMPHPEDHLPEHCGEVVFVQPEMRSIFPLGDLRQQKELMRTIRSKRWSYTWNSSFAQVMDLCSNREDTWINDDFKAVYKKLNSLGHAHSIEVWQEKTLVGGLYGVQIGAAFFAESMVSVQTSGSKAALFFLHGHLLCGGFELLETQFVTEHLTFMGARNLSEKEYKPLLGKAVQGSAYFDKQQQSTICG